MSGYQQPPAYLSNMQSYGSQPNHPGQAPYSPQHHSQPNMAYPGQNYPPSQAIQPAQPQGNTGAWYSQYYHSLSQQEIQHLQSWFSSVDTDKSGSIDQRELSQMTMPGSGPYSGRVLGPAPAAMLIRLFDIDNSGTIDFFEYAALHSFMDKLNGAFQRADCDQNGALDMGEITAAMQMAGFHVDPIVVRRYFDKYAKGDALDFVQFMHMIADISLVKSRFESLDRDRDGRLNLDEVLCLCSEVAAASIVPVVPTTTGKPTTHQEQQPGACRIC